MTAVETARDALFGNPPSPTTQPSREGILAAFATLETALGNVSIGASTSVVKATKALIDADLAHDEGAIGIVWNDATDANNDLYVKVGESGTGSWQNTGALSETLSALSYPYVVLAESWADTSEGFAGDAETAASAAGASEASAAEHAATAAAAAITAPGVYETTGDGLAAVGEGETFWVESVDGPVLYRKESGVAVEIDTLPGLGRVEAAEATATEAKESVDLLGKVVNPLSNGPSVHQFDTINFLNSTVSASAVAAGTVDQPNINGGKGYLTTLVGDGVTTSFNVSPGFTVADVAYRNILVLLVVRATGAQTLWSEGTNYTVTGKGTGTITITPNSTLAATSDLQVHIYDKSNSAYSPLLNFLGFGYDNRNDGSGPMLVMFGAHHVNIGNTGGHNSFLGGSSNLMKSATSYTAAFGLSNTASAAVAGVVAGMRNYVTGSAPTAFGASCKAGGWSLAVGELCDASALYSQAFGRGAKSRIGGDLAQSVGSSADPSPGRMGLHQYGLRRVLTSASFATAIPSTGDTYFAMPLGSKAWVELDVLLSEISTANFRKLSLNMCIRRDSGGTMTYEYGDGSGANQNNANEDAANVTPSVNEWSARILTTASGGFNVQVSGQASLTIQALIRARVLCIADDAAAV